MPQMTGLALTCGPGGVSVEFAKERVIVGLFIIVFCLLRVL